MTVGLGHRPDLESVFCDPDDVVSKESEVPYRIRFRQIYPVLDPPESDDG